MPASKNQMLTSEYTLFVGGDTRSGSLLVLPVFAVHLTL